MNFNPVVWFELYVDDMDRARRFYETVLQLELSPLPTPDGDAADADVQMVAFPSRMENGGAAGALVHTAMHGPGAGGTIVYFTCADCAVEAERAANAGGHVVKPKFAIGQFGFCALVNDSEGNLIGLHSMA